MNQKVYFFIHTLYLSCVISFVSEVLSVVYLLETFVDKFLNVMTVWVNLHELS